MTAVNDKILYNQANKRDMHYFCRTMTGNAEVQERQHLHGY